MVDPAAAVEPILGWMPSKYQPSPSCLGDFLKLMGHSLPEISTRNAKQTHLTTDVRFGDFSYHLTPSRVFDALRSSMEFFVSQWQESHLSGELSKFGNFPDARWILTYDDAMRCVWRQLTFVSPDAIVDYFEDDSIQKEYTLDEANSYGQPNDPGNETLFQQARMILDHMWTAENPRGMHLGQEEDWRIFQRQMQGAWSKPLLHAMLLLAAMVNCRIPLSCIGWVNQLFVPGYLTYRGLEAIGLLAKHARQPNEMRHQTLVLLCIGQHFPQISGKSEISQFGKDHFLIDPKGAAPIGIAPDFLPDQRTVEEYTKIRKILYCGTYPVIGDNRLALKLLPLKHVHIV